MKNVLFKRKTIPIDVNFPIRNKVLLLIRLVVVVGGGNQKIAVFAPLNTTNNNQKTFSATVSFDKIRKGAGLFLVGDFF